MAILPMNRASVLVFKGLFAVACSSIILAMSGCGGEPFNYVKVQGKVTYEDGSLIPADRIVVRFVSMTPSRDRKITPLPGNGEVDVKTGVFSSVTSHKARDGIVRGDHKVVILAAGPLVPVEYTKVETTPLQVNAKDSPFDFKIKKPHDVR